MQLQHKILNVSTLQIDNQIADIGQLFTVVIFDTHPAYMAETISIKFGTGNSGVHRERTNSDPSCQEHRLARFHEGVSPASEAWPWGECPVARLSAATGT